MPEDHEVENAIGTALLFAYCLLATGGMILLWAIVYRIFYGEWM